MWVAPCKPLEGGLRRLPEVSEVTPTAITIKGVKNPSPEDQGFYPTRSGAGKSTRKASRKAEVDGNGLIFCTYNCDGDGEVPVGLGDVVQVQARRRKAWKSGLSNAEMAMSSYYGSEADAMLPGKPLKLQIVSGIASPNRKDTGGRVEEYQGVTRELGWRN